MNAKNWTNPDCSATMCYEITKEDDSYGYQED